MTRPTVGMEKARKLATELRRKNREGRSYRTIAREDYGDRVNFATLNRIAINRGAWLPRDMHILKELGLITDKPKGPRLPKWLRKNDTTIQWFVGQREKIKKMSVETRDEVKKRRQPGDIK